MLSSGHRYVGPNQAMPNPRLAQYQIDEIVALFDTLRVGGQYRLQCLDFPEVSDDEVESGPS